MARVDWYFAETGPGQISDITAHTHDAVRGVREAANFIGERAASNLDTRAVHRTEDSQIEVKHRGSGPDLDSYVMLVDPEGGAAGIEFGWSQISKAGNEYGHDGLGVLRDAVSLAVLKAKVR